MASDKSPLGHLRRAKQLLNVETDDLKVYFAGARAGTSAGMRGIGTDSLNGCTCVVILGTTANLMAHISPYPGRCQANDERNLPQASHEHHERYMTNIAREVRLHAVHFPPSSTAWGVVGEDNVKSIERQVQTHLEAIGYRMRPAFYKELDDSETLPPPKGELVAFFLGSAPQLYLERDKLWPEASQTTTTPSAASVSRSGAAQPSRAQAEIQSLWEGYPVHTDAEGQRTLTFSVSGQRATCYATWTEGHPLPMLYISNKWMQTQKAPDADILVVRSGDKQVRLERP